MEEKPTTITTSKEHVAYKLAEKVLYEERYSKTAKTAKIQEIDEDFRKYYLDLYAECLKAANVKNFRISR